MIQLIRFLKSKISNISFSHLLFLEVEAWMFYFFCYLPGGVGFIFRNLIASFLFNKKDGFAWIQPHVTFVHTNKLKVGKGFGVNSGSYINAIGGITMGDYVLIGSNVTISSGMHPIDGKFPSVYERPTVPMPITIEDDVWIGAGAVIMPNITLAKGTVVGANAVVTKSTQSYSVVVGAPAKHLRFR